MIIDKEECKRLVGETDSTHDAEIEVLIPMAQEDLCGYCNTYFRDDKITYDASNIAFVKGDPDTITDNESEFVKKRFAAGMDIVVEWAHANNGIHELSTVAAGTLTLTSSNELVSMAYSDSDYPLGVVRISQVVWPKPLKLVVARMVWYLVSRPKPTGELSENRDGVVKSYDRRTGYPREIMQLADKYRVPSFG